MTTSPVFDAGSTTAGGLSLSDRPAKLTRLRDLLRKYDAHTIVLTSPEMLSWLLDGARVHIAANGSAVAAAAVSLSDEYVVVSSNEIDRLLAEQLPDGVNIEGVPWHTPCVDLLPKPDGVKVLAEHHVAQPLRALRASLLPLELARYRDLCRDTARLATDTALDIRPEHTELEVAAKLGAEVVAIGAEPLVILVGGAAREQYRHPLPSDRPIGRRTLMVLCARRHGMIANLSRWREFGQPDPNADEAHLRLLDAEADVFRLTRPGTRISAAFDTVCQSYERHGFDSMEWVQHHQGGPTGYFGRDPRATDVTHDVIDVSQAFAWNLTAPAAKTEDTILTTEDPSDPIEILTVDERWPTTQVAELQRPVALAE